MPDIFVSYASDDRDWAFWIGRELQRLGHKPRIHEWEIPPGGDIAAWMEERIQKADYVLCVISKVYLTKPYSSWERRAAQWAAASKRPTFALPVFIGRARRRDWSGSWPKRAARARGSAPSARDRM